jgi:hypothetical protein
MMANFQINYNKFPDQLQQNLFPTTESISYVLLVVWHVTHPSYMKMSPSSSGSCATLAHFSYQL